MALPRYETAFQHVALGLQIEGIPYLPEYKADGALFTWGMPFDGSATLNYGIEPQPLSEQTIPDNIDGHADFWEGGSGIQAGTFKLVATDDVTKRLCASPHPEGKLFSDISQSTQSVTVSSPRTPTAGEYLYIGDETLYVRSVSSSGFEHTCTVWRGAANSPRQSHLAGDAVYWQPPRLPRRMWLYLYDNLRETEELVWHGLLDGLKTNDQQTQVLVEGADPLVTLVGSKGGTDHPWDTSNLKWAPDGQLRGSLEYDKREGFPEPDWVNTSVLKVFQVGDLLYRFRLEGGDLEPINAIDLTSHEEDEGTTVKDETVREVLCVLREQENGEPQDTFVHNSFTGVYGDNGHAAAIALALMLSNGGTSDNNPIVGGSQLVFDVVGQSWGMGVPVDMIDAESWKWCIDNVPAPVDRLILNWDDRYGFEEVVYNKLLIPYGFRPVPTKEGKIGLVHLDTWKHDTIEQLKNDDGTGSYAYLLPTRIQQDWRLAETSAQARAKLGGTPYGADSDSVTSTQLVGNRSDYQGNQSPIEFDRTTQFKSRRSEVEHWLMELSEKRRETPPVLRCVLPLHTRDNYRSLGIRGRVPQLLQWVAVSTDDMAGEAVELIGPNGERVNPRETDITFIGLVVGRTLRFKTGEVDVEVLLVNWALGDRSPMLIAPADRILSHIDEEVILAGDYQTVDGKTGFTQGDQVVITEEDGRLSWKAPEPLVVEDVDDPQRTLYVPGIAEAINSSERLYVRLADFDDYANEEVGNSYYNNANADVRRTAFVADDTGALGVEDEEGDKYA